MSTIGASSARAAATVSFDRRTPVYYMEPNIWPDRWMGRQAWLLYPVVAHRALLAESREGGLNIFQRVVLDLCRAGVRASREIAARSGLGVPFTDVVVAELQSMMLIDPSLVPTSVGERELDHADDDDRPTIPAQIFTDPWTGTVVPRVAVGELPGVREWQWKDADRGRFTGDALGKPVGGIATCVFSGSVLAPRPRSNRALEALRLHRQAWFQFADRNQPADESRKPIQAARLVMTDAAPRPAYLLTFAYVPQSALLEYGWTVADPFGIGRSDEAARHVRRATQHRALVCALDELLKSAAERVSGEAQVVYTNRRAEAERSVRDRLGVPTSVPFRWQRVLACAFHAEAEDIARHHRASEFEGNVASAAGIAFEALLATMLEDRLGALPLHVLSHDPERTREALEQISIGLGFSLPNREGGLRLLRMTHGKVWWTQNRDLRGLKPLIALNLIAAAEDHAHPMRVLAREWPDALQFLEGLNAARNPESHGEAVTSGPNPIDALEGMYRALSIVGAEVGFATSPSAKFAIGAGSRDNVQERIRIEAIAAVDQRYGVRIESYSGLRDRLRRMEYRLAWLRDAASDDSGWSSVQPTSIELLREAGPAVELALAELLKSGERWSRGRPWSADLVADARSLGFAIDDEAPLRVIMEAKREIVMAAAERCIGSLGALGQALVRSAVLDPEHPLRAIALRRPRWLESIAQIAHKRGHADRPLESSEECEQVAELVREIVRDVLGALSGEHQHPNEPGNEIYAQSTR